MLNGILAPFNVSCYYLQLGFTVKPCHHRKHYPEIFGGGEKRGPSPTNSKPGIEKLNLENCHGLGSLHFDQMMSLMEIFLGGGKTK